MEKIKMFYVYHQMEDGAHLIHQTESIDEANQIASTTPNAFILTEEQLREYTNQQPRQRRGIVSMPRQQGGQSRGINTNPGMFKPHIVKSRRRY